MQHIELIRGNNRYTMHRNNIKQRSWNKRDSAQK
jgi:hypothetical protein